MGSCHTRCCLVLLCLRKRRNFRETMSQVGAWLSTLVQQALAILLGGLVAVGWGRDFADWVKGTVEDLGSQWIAYIDVPRVSGNEAYYYIGSLPPERPPVRDGQYRTYRKVSDPYVRYEFIPTRHIRSRRELYRSLMTGLLTQGDGYIHILQGHSLCVPARTVGSLGTLLGGFNHFRRRQAKREEAADNGR